LFLHELLGPAQEFLSVDNPAVVIDTVKLVRNTCMAVMTLHLELVVVAV
jgi:hypothetical protein